MYWVMVLMMMMMLLLSRIKWNDYERHMGMLGAGGESSQMEYVYITP